MIQYILGLDKMSPATKKGKGNHEKCMYIAIIRNSLCLSFLPTFDIMFNIFVESFPLKIC